MAAPFRAKLAAFVTTAVQRYPIGGWDTFSALQRF
jgi:hypothetical protein